MLFENCAQCHRPGQAGPFSLLTYAEAKKHAKQIAEVTRKRYMPPWLAEPGYVEFAGERRVSFVYLRQNRLPDARSEFETVVRLNPEDYQAHGSLGSIWLRLGRLDEAESCFRTALRINPDDVVAQKNLERLLKQKRP